MSDTSTDGQEYSASWMDYLKDHEKPVVQALLRKGASLDTERRQVTSELSLFRQRCSKRKDAMARKSNS